MKDSGIKWLGEVPDHWKVLRLKFLADCFGGGTPSKEKSEYWNGNIPWVSPKDMKALSITSTIDYITDEGLAESTTTMVPENTVLIVVRSGILRHTIPVALNNVPVALNQDMKGLICNEQIKADYLMLYVHACQEQLLQDWRKQGCTVESIESELMLNSLTPVPPIQEQDKIIAFVNERAEPIEKMIDETALAISKLQEYRTALITAAVTGKIDIRNVNIERTEGSVGQ